MHCYLKPTLSLGDNLAGSWDISRNLPIPWRRNWDKLIFSVHFQTLDGEAESSTISRDRLEHTNYLGPSQQGENCFLNQPVFYKPWRVPCSKFFVIVLQQLKFPGFWLVREEEIKKITQPLTHWLVKDVFQQEFFYQSGMIYWQSVRSKHAILKGSQN